MTIAEAIERLDGLSCNQLDTGVKIRWLSELDGNIYREILQTHVQTAELTFQGYDGNTAMDTVLLAPPPYDQMYVWYLEMKLFDALGEMTRYNNAAQKFNTGLLAYGDYVNRTSTPLGQTGLRLV